MNGKVMPPSFYPKRTITDGRTTALTHSFSNVMARPLSASFQRGHVWQDELERWGWLLVGYKCAFMDDLAFSGAWHALMTSMRNVSSSETNRL